MERKRSSGFRRIFKVAFLLFLTLMGLFPNPTGQSLTFTLPNQPVKATACEYSTKPTTSISFHGLGIF